MKEKKKTKKFRMTNRIRENIYGWMFVALWVIGFLVFTLYPLIRTFVLSFFQVTITSDGIRTIPLGLANYKNAFLSDVEFVDALLTYVGELIVQVPIIIVFSLVIAMIVNMNLKGKGLMRTVFFLPVIIVSGPVMQELIDSGATTIQGVEDMRIMQELIMVLPGVLGTIFSNLIDSFIMILWFCGVQILIFLSALQKIDRPVYEAAYIDGASKWESFWKITLPNLRPIVIINIVYTIVFISTFALNDVIVLIQEYTFSVNQGLGYASATAFIYFVVLVLVLALFVKIYGLRSEADKRLAKREKRRLKAIRRKNR